jgi:hypothetical protein
MDKEITGKSQNRVIGGNGTKRIENLDGVEAVSEHSEARGGVRRPCSKLDGGRNAERFEPEDGAPREG